MKYVHSEYEFDQCSSDCQAIVPSCPIDIISVFHGSLEDYIDEPVDIFILAPSKHSIVHKNVISLNH